MPNNNNVQWHIGLTTRSQRWGKLGCHGGTVWLTGLPASGKSTLASGLEKALINRNKYVYVLDGDNIRHGLNKNLGFSREDRAENIRRIGEVAKLFADSGCIVIVACISPYQNDRDTVRLLHQEANLDFFEVFVNAPINVCEHRDPKGQYQMARIGKIHGFTGVDGVYEPSKNAELILMTAENTVEDCVYACLLMLIKYGLIYF